jgi:RimJ/RimL family protein N-acetyltransferase
MTALTPAIIDDPAVRLRPFRVEDADDVATACADPISQRFLPTLPSPYTRDDALAWINGGAPEAFARGGAAFALADRVTDRVLGAVGLTPIGPRRAEIGYWAAPWARRRGVATAGADAMTRAGFQAGYGRLELRTEAENAPSQRVAIAAGYRRECRQRGVGIFRDGSRYDLLLWARLDTDPPGPTPRLLPDLPGGELTDGTVRLRPLGPADAEDTARQRRLPEVVATSVPPVAPDPADVARDCAEAQAHWLAGGRAAVTIRDAVSGAYAGEIGVAYFEPTTGQAIMGYSVAPAWRGRGYARRAVRLLAGWALDVVNIPRLIAGTAPDNVASQRVLLAAGFRQEGYQRARLPGPAGTRLDDLLFALLPGDLAAG